MNYYNTRFINRILPNILFATIILFVILAGYININFPHSIFATLSALLVIFTCMFYKFIHQRLEYLSTKQRQDYGLINKNGVLYPFDLTDATEDDIKEIKAVWK